MGSLKELFNDSCNWQEVLIYVVGGALVVVLVLALVHVRALVPELVPALAPVRVMPACA